ncbi:MAG: DHH family phosphoesterase [Bdellovibrionaceae bacterium]|nr:DHH family phosphoesterase [Pseudobdellovibrionaceae bacterium]
MSDVNIQNRNQSNGSPVQKTAVLDFYNQIPAKLRTYLEKFNLSTPQEMFDFLQPKLSTLENPYKIDNCEKASERLWNAFVNQETVLIYGDYDLDGTSGIILLYDSFKALGFQNLHYFQPSKANDGYGLHAHILERFKTEKNIDVVVTVDVGITGNAACDRAKDLGIDVIVTDHHLAQDELPNAYTIVNPNQPGDQSGLGYLCGCGVGFYLVRGLCKKWIEKGSPVPLDLKSILPYFAVATVTDMVPLVKDNRTLLKFAFESFKNVTNLGFKTLLAELNLNSKKLDTSDIGLQLAPKINAITRMSAALKPIDLFFKTSEADAKAFAKDILKLNVERKQLQEAGLKEAKAAYEEYLKTNTVDSQDHHRVFFYASENIHHGVTGLVASKMVDSFGGSFFIGAHSTDTDVVVGSSRKPDHIQYSLVDLMAISKDSWIRFGGHASAAGFEYLKSNEAAIWNGSKDFLTTAKSASTAAGAGGAISTNICIDPIALDWFDLNTHFFTWVQFLEPFGSHFPEPVFKLNKVPVLSVKVMKEKHFKLNVVNPHNREALNFVLFNSTEEQRQLLNSLNRELSICFKIKKDTFNYNQRFQFIIESIEA